MTDYPEPCTGYYQAIVPFVLGKTVILPSEIVLVSKYIWDGTSGGAPSYSIRRADKKHIGWILEEDIIEYFKLI